MAITKVFKIIDPRSLEVNMPDSLSLTGQGGLYGNYTWYHRLVQGSPRRTQRYNEYDMMDTDVDVARALDLIAEEMAGNNPKTETPLIIKLELDGGVKVQSRVVVTLNAALKTWCNIHNWKNRIFSIARNVIKYGDCFFARPTEKNKRFTFIPAKNVVAAGVDERDITDIISWNIKMDDRGAQQSGNTGQQLFFSLGSGYLGNVSTYKKDDIIRFTLNDEMSEDAPFGRSVLSDAFRAFKQKQLLEDAVLIYRIQRAPERRVFYIDVAHVHPAKVAQHLEQIKNEFRQRRIPSPNGANGEAVESIYNPQSMNEDFFFARYKDGAGTQVETLPAGQSLGELQDLDYFYRKMWRGLRIPVSYIDPNTEGATSVDGKVGIAYLQEIKFSLYIERLQSHLETTFDSEFKRFLRDSNILVDESIFKVTLPSPSNYDVSRKQAIDGDLLGNFTHADGFQSLSKRFAMKKYLQLSDDEIIVNERMKREEMGINPDGDYRDLPRLYNPEAAEAGGFEGGLGSFGHNEPAMPEIGGETSEEAPPDEGGEEIPELE
jgi:hypothetical protein